MTSHEIPERIIRSARLTARAWGLAYIGVTRSTENIAGGVWVESSRWPIQHWTDQPVGLVSVMTDEGLINPSDEWLAARGWGRPR